MLNENNKIKHRNAGATLVEFVIIVPVLLFSLLGIMQAGLVFHAKSNVNYAAFEAARAGSMRNAQLRAIRTAFATAMTGFYGGGRNAGEIATSRARAFADVTLASAQIELLSPSAQSFTDYASPRLSKKYSEKYNATVNVIPNSNLSVITCPTDNKGCNSNPTSNASGQTLSDANILKLRITYGIPQRMQMPLVGRLYVMVLRGLRGVRGEVYPLLGLDDPNRAPIAQDTFIQGLLAQNRIPIVVHTTMRMQSDAIQNGNADGGPGNNGLPGKNVPDEPVFPEGSEPDDGGAGGGNPNAGGSGGSEPCDL